MPTLDAFPVINDADHQLEGIPFDAIWAAHGVHGNGTYN
jgi:hypothetical protein